MLDSYLDNKNFNNIDFIKIEIHFKQRITFNFNTFLLDQKVFKKSRLTLSLCELHTTKIHFGFGNNVNSTFHSTNESRPQALWILAVS